MSTQNQVYLTTKRKFIAIGGSRAVVLPPHFLQAMDIESDDDAELSLIMSPAGGRFVTIKRAKRE